MTDSLPVSLDDTQLVDKLRTIRPFTESQLLTLYNNSQLDSNAQFINSFIEENVHSEDTEFFQLLIRLEKGREHQAQCNERASDLKLSCETSQERVWRLNKKTILRTSKCGDGRPVEAKHEHQESMLNCEELKDLEKNLLYLRENISNDCCFNNYLVQLAQLEVEAFINDILGENDSEVRRVESKKAIGALFAFQRKPKNHDTKFLELSREWLVNLVSDLLSIATLDDHLFLLNQIIRCPAGFSSWTTPFLQCPNPLSISDSELSSTYVNHSLTVISTILSPILARDRFLGSEMHKTNSSNNTNDETWLLVDPHDESEDVTSSHLQIAETDVIRFLKQIPFDDVLRSVARTGTQNDASYGNSMEEVAEMTMLKLLAFSTTLIRILKQGLHSFNCTRFKSLTEHISSLIRKTVLAISQFWMVCKEKFMAHDPALVLRLQVEYDHFILRSIIAILGTNRQGVWKFLAVFPFDGVSESMMWHILWVMYNNGRDEQDELGGLCPYFSDTYWKSKFQEATVQYLFREKLNSLPTSESHNLLVTLYNMAKSRGSTENEYINTIGKEIFEISFQSVSLSSKMTDKGKKLLCNLIAKNNFLISECLLKSGEVTTSEVILDLFTEIPLHVWKPRDEEFDLLYEWLTTSTFYSLPNKIARLILSRLNWGNEYGGGVSDSNILFLTLTTHRECALKIFESIVNHMPREVKKCIDYCGLKEYGMDKLIFYAKSSSFIDYTKWCWILIQTLKLNILDQPNTDWDAIIEGNDLNSQRAFRPIPCLVGDNKLLPILRHLEEKHPIAIYISLIMTDLGHSRTSLEKSLDLLEHLLSNLHFIPSLHILSCLIPLNANNLDLLLTNSKLISTLSQMIVVQSEEIISIINHQMARVNLENRKKLISCWISMMYEITEAVIRLSSSSWFTANSKGLQEVAYLFDRIAMLVYSDESLSPLVVEHVSKNPYNIQDWKLPSPSWFSSILTWGSSSPINSSIKKCEWITPFHLVHKQFPDMVWLGRLIIESDALKTDKIWDDLISELSHSQAGLINLELIIKTICANHNHSPIPQSLLPLNACASQALTLPLEHELSPLIWYKFFTCYFYNNSSSTGSIGMKLISTELKKKLFLRLNAFIDYQHKIWVKSDEQTDNKSNLNNELTKLYRAFFTWLDDSRLHEVFISLDELPAHYMSHLLKPVLTNSQNNGHLTPYIDSKKIEKQMQYFLSLYDELKTNIASNNNLEIALEQSLPKTINESSNNNLLSLTERKRSNLSAFTLDREIVNYNEPALLGLIQHNIRLILEEAKFFESRLKKYDTLNKSLIEDLPSLYRNVRKEVKLRAACEKDTYDHCIGPALIEIDFVEANENLPISKQIERNRIEFENVVTELLESPSNKVVSSTLYIEKYLTYLLKKCEFNSSEQSNVASNLLGSFLSWLNENDLSYAPSKQVFTTLLDTLSSATLIKPDETNLFILETAMNHPKIIQYLAPKLELSKCSSQTFLNMYKFIQGKLLSTPSQVAFVLLSKFDVSQWLRLSSVDHSLTLIETMGNSLYSFGDKPSEERLMVLGLYRKHLQYAIIFRFPDYLKSVLQIILRGMTDQKVPPVLWNDVLLSFGFFLSSIETFEKSDMYGELRKYANNQPLFTSNELYDIMTMLSTYFTKVYQELHLELLEHYKQYIYRYLVFLSTISFCWINTNSRMPPSHVGNIWNPLYDVWKFWLFPNRSTKFINEKDYNYVWKVFAINITYFIECFQGMVSNILSCVWQIVFSYLNETKALSQNDINLILNSLSNFPWSKFCPSFSDIKVVYKTLQLDKYSMSEFISDVLSKVNWSHAMQIHFVEKEDLPEMLEQLTYILIAISKQKQLQSMQLTEVPFHHLPSSKVQFLSQVIVRDIRLSNYLLLDKQAVKDAFLFALLKEVCLHDSYETQWVHKQIIYTHSVSNLIINFSRDEELLKSCREPMKAFISSYSSDLSNSIQPEMLSSDRIHIFNELFQAFNGIANEDLKTLITDQLMQSLNYKNSDIIRDLLNSAYNTIKSLSSLVQITEHYIGNYFSSEGDIVQLSLIMDIPVNLVDDYLVTCSSKNACLNFYIYLVSSLSKENDQKKFMCIFINWCSQLKPNFEDEAKVLLLWFRVLSICDNLIDGGENSVELMQSVHRLSKHLFQTIEDSVSQGFLSLLKSNRKSFSVRCAFLSLCLSLFGCKRQLEFTTPAHPLNSEFNQLNKSIMAKLQSLKKNKSFLELVPLIDNIQEVAQSSQDWSKEMSELLKSWLIIFYSHLNLYLKVLLDNF